MPSCDVNCKNTSDGRFMLPREFLGRSRVKHSEELVCPGSCAENEYQPRALKVWHGFDALQEEALILELAPQLGFHELLVSQNTIIPDWSLGSMWSPRHTIMGGVISLPAWRMRWQPVGKKPPLLNNCVLPKLMRMPAQSHEALSNSA